MKGIFFSVLITTILASLFSCNTAKQSATVSTSIVGKYWKLIELNGETVRTFESLKQTPHMILNASENRVNGNGGCNSFFGTYELQGDKSITFSKIGSIKMACENDVMQVESKLFQGFEMTKRFTLNSDTLTLTNTDMSVLAKFILSDMK